MSKSVLLVFGDSALYYILQWAFPSELRKDFLPQISAILYKASFAESKRQERSFVKPLEWDQGLIEIYGGFGFFSVFLKMTNRLEWARQSQRHSKSLRFWDGDEREHGYLVRSKSL